MSTVTNQLVSTGVRRGPGPGDSPSEAAGNVWAQIQAQVSQRPGWLMLAHAMIFLAVYWVAFGLRFDFAIPQDTITVFWANLPWIIAMKLGVFFVCGHFQGWWRYVTFADLTNLLKAASLAFVIAMALDRLLALHLPRVVLVLDCVITIFALGGLRSCWRLAQELKFPLAGGTPPHRALLVGTGQSAGVLANQIHAHPDLGYRVCGFLETNGCSVGRRLGGIRVLGKPEHAAELAKASRADEVLVIAGSLAGGRLRQLMKQCAGAGLSLKIIPPVQDLFRGTSQVPIRNVEISDLLRRDPVELDDSAIGSLLKGRTVMVTGAGGSIGSEICRQLLKYQPGVLMLVGKGEHSLFKIEGELQRIAQQTKLICRIGDVTDEGRMRRLFEEHHPEIVFHAAAHKHVPMMEDNVGEAVKNNVLGTRRIAELADEFGVSRFVFISTDKAVNPSSVMGVTKQISERWVHALSQESSTRFMVVRFGNVLGSAGSVVPTFLEQIKRGGPITITDERMTRFFMTIPEASQLVLQAMAMGRGGEIFVLDMGEPLRIVDLAHDLVRLSGLPDDAIEIVFTGPRPGEKLHEELYLADEETTATSHHKLRSAFARPYSISEVRSVTSELEEVVNAPQAVIRHKLQEIVLEYRPPDFVPPVETEPHRPERELAAASR